eukprot:PITA_03326
MARASTSMGICNAQLPQFNGKNYEYWAITMRALFASQDLWEFVEDGFEEPTDEDEFNNLTQAEKELLKSNKKKDSKALYFLYQAVHESVFPRIEAAKRSKETWQTLMIAYQGMEKVKTTKLQLLRRDFQNLCMKEKKQHDMNNRTSANFTRENISQDNLFLPCNMAEAKSEDIWFLDFGCSHHMIGNIALFSKLDQSGKSQVTLWTDSKVSVMGKGEVNVLTRKGEKKTVADVYYVPGMKCNLLSIGQLVQKGYNVFFVNDVCTIMDKTSNKQCIAEVKMTRNRMFPLRMKFDLKNGEEIAAVTQEAFQSEPKDENWLWHLRFGHLSFGGLNLLNRKGMVRGLPLIEKPDSLCEGCILGKQHRESFPSGKRISAKSPLEIVHSDLYGPMQTPSLASSHYILTFIDDFTRKRWVYFLKNKSEVFERFFNFKALVENQSSKN